MSKANRPSASLVAEWREPVALLTSTMTACGTRAPQGSSTVPRTAPVAASWAPTATTKINGNRKVTKRRRAQFEPRDIGIPPVVEMRLGGQALRRYRKPAGTKMRTRAKLTNEATRDLKPPPRKMRTQGFV